MNKLINFLTLFSSFGTLICCALPALLVSLGLGATLVSATTVFPQLIWVSENKIIIFIFAGLMLLLSGVSYLSASKLSCPLEAGAGEACRSARGYSGYLLMGSVIIYLVGFAFAFILPLFQ